MKNVRSFEINEFVDFCKTQKDDRLVDMTDITSEGLGCPLVHFVRKKMKRKIIEVGHRAVKTDRGLVFIEEPNLMYQISEKLRNKRVKNYQQVKQILNSFNL